MKKSALAALIAFALLLPLSACTADSNGSGVDLPETEFSSQSNDSVDTSDLLSEVEESQNVNSVAVGENNLSEPSETSETSETSEIPESSEPTEVPEAPKPPNGNVEPNPPQPSYNSEIPSSVCAAIYDAETMKALFAQNADLNRSPASITKLVTAMVALRHCSLDDVYTVGSERNLVSIYSSVSGLTIGCKLTLSDLLYALLVCSGNDAAYTIAVNVARSVADEPLDDATALKFFCDMMNELAAELGLMKTVFANPDGYDDVNQYSTAYELALIAKSAMQVDEIRKIASTSEISLTILSGQTFYWKNSNRFLHKDSAYYDSRVIGLKTGSTGSAGLCLVTVAIIDEREYVAVVLGCQNEDQRYGCTKTLLDLVENANAD